MARTEQSEDVQRQVMPQSTSGVEPRPPLAKGWDATNWDLNVQQPHGGQEWSSLGDRLVEDFSVTTNFMGPPWKAISAATASLQHIDHYPAANCEPALRDLATWLMGDRNEDLEDLHSRLLLGNGASELIDLVIRIAAPEGSFRIRSDVQYKEYERAALADGREKQEHNTPLERDWSILAIINPCNPTGEYLEINALKSYIETVSYSTPHSEQFSDKCVVVVDESMQLWYGEDWREDSLVSQSEWIQYMAEERNVFVYVIHSWTKIWSCPGIRLGSILCPRRAERMQLASHQVPWSLNICALAFLSAAIKDVEYLRQTWELNRLWRARMIQTLQKMYPSWEFHGPEWISWIWIDTKSAEDVAQLVRQCKAAGVPIRNGAMGYHQPTFIRLGIRAPAKQDVLFAAMRLPKSEPARSML
eukprot:TRINITY_DN18579_c0_g1_i1.p1 TRINITY_DN18579_c0_g1~~TRINITY_DN18579_c0_g1_i1.p1  ORF type:complete len:441 (-),score=63.13 TRINITY_DN18579_c0_g1_i1:549-1799(-)